MGDLVPYNDDLPGMLDQIDRVANMIDWGIRQGQRFYHHYRRADALRS